MEPLKRIPNNLTKSSFFFYNMTKIIMYFALKLTLTDAACIQTRFSLQQKTSSNFVIFMCCVHLSPAFLQSLFKYWKVAIMYPWSLLQDEQHQVFQPFLKGEVFHASNFLYYPPLDLIHQVHSVIPMSIRIWSC